MYRYGTFRKLGGNKMGKHARVLSDEQSLTTPDLESRPDSETAVDAQDTSIRRYMWQDVDPEQSNLPLAACCFMTGFIDAVTFTAVSVWCGFQTGNTIELALALARLCSLSESPGPNFRIVDRQSLTSIMAFLIGAFVGRIGDHMGTKTRVWLCMGTFLQAFFTLFSALLLWKGGQPSFADSAPTWTNAEGYVALAFASASMGLQGIMAKRVNTQFATTIVLTTVWCELMADPNLFSPRLVKGREVKVLAVSALFLGGFAGRALLDKAGAAATFGIGTGFRVIIAFLWLIVPTKEDKK